MALASTPVDAELAVARGNTLIASANVVVNGSDYESPAVLGYALDPADQAHDYNPAGDADPNRPNSPGENDYETPNPERQQRVRWVDGFNFLPDDCDGGHIVDPCQLGAGADTADTRSASTDIVGPIQPFIIEASDTASTWLPEKWRLARANRKLLAVQSKVLEAEFWNGTKATSQTWAQNQYLSKAAGLTVLPAGNVGAALGYIDGLAALEQAIADGSAWQQGMIHATPRLVTHWIRQGLVEAAPGPGGMLRTQLGTIVVAGRGYPGTGPNTGIHLTHLQWAYATPVPQIRLGEITLNQTDEDTVAVSRDTNDRTIRVSRFAAITFSPCFRAGALVNLTTELAVPGS